MHPSNDHDQLNPNLALHPSFRLPPVASEAARRAAAAGPSANSDDGAGAARIPVRRRDVPVMHCELGLFSLPKL